MPKIIQLSAHVANLIAAGEVVERPASVVKELLENAVDAGASQVTVELRDGGMTFLRVTDNGCGMTAEDARTAFLRHATSKLRCPEDLNAIGTMGFRGEALAAIASVSRVDLLTKTAGAVAGTGLHLEAGQIIEQSEAGCPEGTTIIVRDLFFNTPARMKFMKQDSVEGAAVAAAVQRRPWPIPRWPYVFCGTERKSSIRRETASCCLRWRGFTAGKRQIWCRWRAIGKKVRCGAMSPSPPRPEPAGPTRPFLSTTAR